MTTQSKGSEWRIWDLHVHTPATYGGDYDEFISSASGSIASVIGINDYCTLSGYEEINNRGAIPGKVIFPVVEMRMTNILQSKHGNRPHINFHIIFDNDPSRYPTISNWLASLDCLNDKGATIKLGVAEDLRKITFDFNYIIKELKQANLYGNHALVWLPYDEYGGIDEIDPVSDGMFKASLIKSAHILGSSTKKQIDFFNWKDKKHSQVQYREWLECRKVCIKGSDAHKINYPFGQLQDGHSAPTNKYCWVNADMTFRGLAQIVIEPDRVFIGEEPSLLGRVRTRPTKFISSLKVSKSITATTQDDWFNNVDIQFNAGLVAIIGNKGSGKSAITDIIGLCGNTHQPPSTFSFLTTEKFRKLKPTNLSTQFEANLGWRDGTSTLRLLSDNPNSNSVELVKYLPQSFIENICNNIDASIFENELKDIIYSHTELDSRLGCTSLDALIAHKSALVENEIERLKASISIINKSIVELEKQRTQGFKDLLENNIANKKSELSAHNSAKPTPPSPSETTLNTVVSANLTKLREEISVLEGSILKLRESRSILVVEIDRLQSAIQYYSLLKTRLDKENSESSHAETLSTHEIATSEVFSYRIDITPIQQILDIKRLSLTDINNQLDGASNGSIAARLLEATTSLIAQQEQLDLPAKLQQKFIDDLKAWEVRRDSIEGNENTADTLKYYESKLNYINSMLGAEIQIKYETRNTLLSQLFSQKAELLSIRRTLFAPITQFINNYEELKQKYDVKVDVALEMNHFAESFFQLVNQHRKGTYQGKDEGHHQLRSILENVDLSSERDVHDFTDTLIQSLKKDIRDGRSEPIDINTQLKANVDLNVLYDYIFFLDYMQPQYSLKLGEKNLRELSPGERGVLLLIFYLILDNSDIPLIIDQPEDNLDNESVYDILVHFIKKVKDNRQIIIVTHNPNLAVVCDSDQIIHMSIEKDNRNKVVFSSGSIENMVMNRSIINVLEGTLPAFDNRDLKYIR